MSPNRPACCLVLLLRVAGTAMLLALVGVFMPVSWMAAVHERLGLGPFPQGPIIEYLARSLSFFYAVMGALFWLLATDLVRYAAAVALMGWVSVIGGLGVIVLDLYLRLPSSWSLTEGPFTVAMGILILLLLRRSVQGGETSSG
mgnify:CR=1 FL=1